MTAHDMYKRIEGAQYEGLRKCPCCGSPAELWQFSKSPTDPTSKVVMCSLAEGLIPAPNDLVEASCPMYMPPDIFYKATAREAIKFWVEYGGAIEALRRKNNWQDHKVLRDDA